jgi:prepilin-type processing-associated H-X9-DG protein
VDDRYEPATIDVERDEGVTIAFRDGHVARFALLELRRACPCAACRGLRDQRQVVWPRPGSPEPLHVDHAELHGGWGLNITWNDGHATGIYPFEALRDWQDRGVAFGPDSGLGGAVNGADEPGDQG